jgi:phosphoribosylformylglycinamidine (FGAM) synthase-like enzyme
MSESRAVAGVADRIGVRAGDDVRKSLTPQLRTDVGDTSMILIDLGRGKNRLGASALAQVMGQLGNGAGRRQSGRPESLLRRHPATER